MKYTAVIRTLGIAGEKYQRELDSLLNQTMPPEDIIVYIAEGYSIPKETCGKERYVYVKKGMVAQRAIRYEEVNTEWILFLDDDVFLPPSGIETLFKELEQHDADVIAPCVFLNHTRSLKTKILMSITGREVCRLFGNRWAYKVLLTAGFSYNNYLRKPVYESQTNAGPCFLCRKADFLKISFEEELWLDDAPYAFPEDQVMFYKMYLSGKKILTSFDSGIQHLDAGSVMGYLPEKQLKLLYSEYRNKYIFWYKYLYSNQKSKLKRLISKIVMGYFLKFQEVKYFFKNYEAYHSFKKGIDDGKSYVKSVL